MTEFLFYFFFFIIPILCLAGYVYEHWWVGGHAIRLTELLSMIFIAVIPCANLIVLACVLDIPERMNDFVVFKPRKR